MRRVVWFVVLTMISALSPASAQFSGTFELGPEGCERTGQCTLTYDFRYRDPNGVEWQAAAQNRTDGASIPPWAQSIVGSPFDKNFTKAAVIHDHYCDRHVRPWRVTHRVFFDALIEAGVDRGKAKVMYYAVYLGGPKWAELIPGRDCGNNCIFQIEDGAQKSGEPPRRHYVTRGQTYNEPDFAAELAAVEMMVKQQGDAIGLDALEKRAESKRPNDFFYKNGDRVSLGEGLATK